MTREEAIHFAVCLKNNWTIDFNDMEDFCDMAIEALSQPIVAKHFDIQSGYIYCSPQIAENVKVVVQCKDCDRKLGSTECPCCTKEYHINEETFYCAWGERKEPLPQYEEWQDEFNKMCESARPKNFVADEWYRDTFKGEEE